jgi:DNA-binding transcriptional LysR family regulator
MRDLNALATFVAVVTANSFTIAADRLGISRALVSRPIQDLENSLGVKLLHRSTRKLGLTQAGERFFDRCSRIVAEAEEAARDLEDLARGSHGLIRISTAITFGRVHLLPAVHEFLALNPDIQIEVTLSERFADLISGNADLVVRLAEEPRLSNLVARRLAPARWVVVASPAYLSANGQPLTPRDLTHCNCLVYPGTKNNEWRFRGKDGEVPVMVSGNLRSNVADGLVDAAVAGVGIAALPSFAVSSYIASGQLVELLTDYCLPERTLYAVFLPDRRLPERVRSFVQFLAERFAGEPYWDRPLARPVFAVDAVPGAKPGPVRRSRAVS